MHSPVWYSQLFENTYNGGMLLVLPYEAVADWDGSGDDYEEVIAEEDQFLFRPLGATCGLFVGDMDGEGIHEAHWLRLEDHSGPVLVVWSSWDDPNRKYSPEDLKQVGWAWEKRQDPRQSWLEQRLRQQDLVWQRHEPVMLVASGVLLLLHAEGITHKARLARPRTVACCGQIVPVGMTPGEYQIETVIIDELPDGAHLCAVCRWVRVKGKTEVSNP